MARLNDPPQSADSYETLRRKLLRQNRDLARVNSTQSLKIRHLENECARMLSENLELRGQILQLEKEVENSKAQRIADHALEIKLKLEEQLAEWGSMLSGLGLEPPAKRRDAIGRRATQSRMSLTKRSPRKSLRDLAREAEARAREEGRLTPIQEHRTYPRATLDEEIMALRSEIAAADISGSSDFGPPPVSRFVEEEESVIPESPSRPPTSNEPLKPEPSPSEIPTSKAKPAEPETTQEAGPAAAAPNPPEPAADAPLSVPSKSGSKRKLGVREDIEPTPTTTEAAALPAFAPRRKSTISKERMGGKTLKELAAIRRESREPAVAPPVPPPVLAPTRKPLAAKSTNEEIASPKKVAGKKGTLPNEKPGKALKSKLSKEDVSQRPVRAKGPAVVVIKETSVLAPEEAVITPLAEPEPERVAALEAHLLSPSPGPKSQAESSDTPPPADISWKGETTRPSRRSRAPVSYAEPNLRDKMRRPTKDMVDAVSGEGKYRRSSNAPVDDAAATESLARPESTTENSYEKAPLALEAPISALPASPLAQKSTVDGNALPSSVVTERRKRRSSVLTKDSIAVVDDQGTPSKSSDDSLDLSISSTTASDSSSHDVYDFPSNSPDTSSDANPSETAGRKLRVSRRVSTAGHTELSLEREEMTKASRKRTPMHVGRRARQDLGPGAYAEDGEDVVGLAAGAKDRALRRKSTML